MIQAITSRWWLFLLRGIAAVIVGAIAFTQPSAALVALVIVLGFYSFVAGALIFAAAFTGVAGDRWWALLLEGVLAMALAFVIWFWPTTSAMAFVYFVAAWLIVSGILQIVTGIRLRDIIDNEWLYILGGVVSTAFGVWVFRSPSQGTMATAYLFGVYFVLYGIMQIVFAFRLRSVQGVMTNVAKAAS